MVGNRSRASGVGLERSCSESAGDWMRSMEGEDGVECLEAWFQGSAYHKHRHDTYAICLTTHGVQAFDYRGAAEISTPGQVVVLHPDELHDGHAGTEAGFGYRMLYIEPALIFEAAQAVCGHVCALPFVRTPVVISPKLSAAITSAFRAAREPLAIDSLIVRLAEGLIDADPSCARAVRPRHLDVAALERALQHVVARHQSLRASFTSDGRFMRVHREMPLKLETVSSFSGISRCTRMKRPSDVKLARSD